MHVFVWTLSDVIGLIFLGLMLLFGIFIGGAVLWDKAVQRWKRRGERAS